MTDLPNRLKVPLLVAISAAIAAVLLAVLPVLINGVPPQNWTDWYDPSLAVLTATLLAVIAYAFFTYWAATRKESTILRLDLDRDKYTLKPTVENPTKRRVTVNLKMRVLIDSERELPQGAFYTGRDDFTLLPGETFSGSVWLYPQLELESAPGEGLQPLHDEIKVVLSADWSDDIDEEGSVGPRYFRLPLATEEVVPTVSSSNRKQYFPAKLLEQEQPFTEGPAPALEHGFVEQQAEVSNQHRLHKPLIDPRVEANIATSEALSGGNRSVVQHGQSYVVTEVHREDVHGCLRSWLGDRDETLVLYRSRMDLENGGIPCKLLIHDPDHIDEPAWHGNQVTVRLVPDRAETTVNELLDAICSAHNRSVTSIGEQGPT